MSHFLKLEQLLGSSHSCQNCRNQFLANKDACPYCGSYQITPLENNSKTENTKDIFCWVTIDFGTGEIEYIFPGDSSPWPKEK